MVLYIPELEQDSVRHFFTTRRFNASDATPFGSKDMFVKTKQVHGDDIHIIDKPVERVADIVRNAAEIKCDAIITNQRHIGIGVVTADCVPVLIYDPVQSVIASVHAGWKGTIKGILSKVICRMSYKFRCHVEDIIVGMGPAIGACCYAVGEIVTEPLKSTNPEWGRYLKPDGNGKAKLDLAALNIRQIEDVGVLTRNIFNMGLCTSCNKELFFSYRRDGVGTGRMISGIMMA
ncbi:MAG: peptidoglycan editing factor PgeF [Nitrospirota bacterium]